MCHDLEGGRHACGAEVDGAAVDGHDEEDGGFAPLGPV